MGWVVISKENEGDRFYPIHIIANDLNALRFDYKEAEAKPLDYWKGKQVVFHLVWKEDKPEKWMRFYKRIAERAGIFWIEFDADNKLFYETDFILQKPLILYRWVRDVSNKFIWELPMDYNPFIKPVVRLPLRIYQRNQEKPINLKKDIDFLVFIDEEHRNVAASIRLLEVLNENHSAKGLIIEEQVYHFYKTKVTAELVKNHKFTEDGEDKFHKLLDRSKVFVDIRYFLTAGRSIYEALFYGALAVCPRCYGASKLLFPDLVVDSYNLNLPEVYQKCLHALSKWSVNTVQTYRVEAFKNAWAGLFIKELKEYAEIQK